jgi:phospholipid/cholesterol/gamma-HCH transport system ATP-binding protein
MHLLSFPQHCYMNEAANPAISFSQVAKSFGQREVLKNVSFHVTHGEALCILGRSGMGKSVALKLMVGLLKPDSGSICIGDENIVQMGEDDLSRIRRGIGFLFQSAALFDSVSLNDNLVLPLKRFKTNSKQELDSIIQNRLDQVGLGNDRYKMPRELSGGMKKRAGLARALVLEPSILLVDEPSSGLDRVTAGEIDDLLFHEKEAKKITMVIVTHDLREARRLGDRLAVFSGGTLLAIGTPDEMAEHKDAAVRALASEKG